MAQNVGSTDRKIRTTAGALAGVGSLGVLAGSLSLPMVAAPVLGVASLMFLVTAATGTCGLYALLGIDTCSMGSETPQ